MRALLWAIGLTVVSVLVAAPLLGWPAVVRLPAVLTPALLLVLLATRPWPWRDSDRVLHWQPSARAVWSAALIVGLLLFWYVMTRFLSGEINAIDFTIYYDRPCWQTVQGRPLFVEVSDTPHLSYRPELVDHAYWAMLPICSLYALQATPLWLHAISVLAMVAGAWHILRISQHLGASGALACATALAFVLNDNTARALNYGFHPEVLYAWFVPWMIAAGLRRAHGSFLAAMLACLLVKEDAVLPLFAASAALALNRFRALSWAERGLFLALPTALALANLAAYYGLVLPMLTGGNRPAYAHFWANYGATPLQAVAEMARSPGRVVAGMATSGIFLVLGPHLFLPAIGWRWAAGIVPIVALYGASANEQVRAFGIYYALVLVPFLVIAASWGALTLTRRLFTNSGQAQLGAAGAVLLGALLVGSSHRGYSLRPWRAEIAAMPDALARLAGEPVVLVQSGLFPHAGYDQRLKLLTPETLLEPRHVDAAVLLAPRVGAFPFKRGDLACLTELTPIAPMPGGLVVVRLEPQALATCLCVSSPAMEGRRACSPTGR